MRKPNTCIAGILAFFISFLILLNAKFGVNMNIIWIQYPELGGVKLQEMSSQLPAEKKEEVKSAPLRKKFDSTIGEKLFVSGLSEFQNIDALKYEKIDDRSRKKDCDSSSSSSEEVKIQENVNSDSIEQIIATDGSKETVSVYPKGEENEGCDIPRVEERFDCHPENSPTKEVCEARGCCWVPTKARLKPVQSKVESDPQAPVDIPYCYYPRDFPGYTVISKEMTKTGFKSYIERNSTAYYPRDVMKLIVDVAYENDVRLHIKIYDPANERYEVPVEVYPSTVQPSKPNYKVAISEPGEPFTISVNRVGVSVNTPVFRTAGAAPLIFSDQFLQLSTFLTSKYVYGLGEHRDTLLHSVNWTRFTMWNSDHGPEENSALYGSHPFHFVIEEDGSSSGVFLLNSNAMDIILQPSPAITWRSIGGILDFYLFIGQSPDDVVTQYSQLIGTSFMPPYWSLGFHICRFGYKSVNDTMKVVDRVRKAGIPQDVQWNDIDYAILKRDFTTDLARFGNQSAMAEELHKRGMHYVIITDPGLNCIQKPGSYQPYDLGLKLDLFVKNHTGQQLVGKVWTGPTVWVDFTHPSAQEYWYTLIKGFHDEVKFDGLWIDMNEVSNFIDGSIYGCPQTEYDKPPYIPAVNGGYLYQRLICPSARHYKWRSYDVHNIYGRVESQVTFEALKKTRGKRPFVISRSTFSGQGHFGGHWTGDIAATYYDMYKSISDILTMGMSGIAMVGSDICGFRNPTSYELCLRWYQLGAFYPFSRTHNSDDVKKDQDPGAFDDRFAAIVRKVYLTRYSLLPYLYTLFWWSNYAGAPVARPLVYHFPRDNETYNNDRQFLWGQALMISPVLSENTTSITAYFPHSSEWYDFYTGKRVSNTSSKSGRYIKLDAPLDHINLHVRGGYIIPMQDSALTTTQRIKTYYGRNFNFLASLCSRGDLFEYHFVGNPDDSRENLFSLLVVIGTQNNEARGELFYDDGDTVGTFESGIYNHVEFELKNNKLQSVILKRGYDSPMMLRNTTIYGILKAPSTVTLRGLDQKFSYNAELQVLTMPELNPIVNMQYSFIMEWK